MGAGGAGTRGRGRTSFTSGRDRSASAGDAGGGARGGGARDKAFPAGGRRAPADQVVEPPREFRDRRRVRPRVRPPGVVHRRRRYDLTAHAAHVDARRDLAGGVSDPRHVDVDPYRQHAVLAAVDAPRDRRQRLRQGAVLCLERRQALAPLCAVNVDRHETRWSAHRQADVRAGPPVPPAGHGIRNRAGLTRPVRDSWMFARTPAAGRAPTARADALRREVEQGHDAESTDRVPDGRLGDGCVLKLEHIGGVDGRHGSGRRTAGLGQRRRRVRGAPLCAVSVPTTAVTSPSTRARGGRCWRRPAPVRQSGCIGARMLLIHHAFPSS